MRTFRSADYYRIKTDKHRLYYASAIPSRFWDERPGDPIFQDATWSKKKISAKTQREWYDKLIDGKVFAKPHIVLFASDPTDETALAHAFHLCKLMVKTIKKDGTRRRIQIDVASDDIRHDAHNASCDIFVLHNVLAKTDRQRVTVVREWLRKHDDVFRLVALAGTPDDFRHSYGIEPNAIFSFSDTTIVRTQKSFG
jgi:hypothetical protein